VPVPLEQATSFHRAWGPESRLPSPRSLVAGHSTGAHATPRELTVNGMHHRTTV